MQSWIDTLNYGDKNISSGIDDFWLPRENKTSIKISPREQAVLIQKLVTGKIPAKESSVNLLKELMKFKTFDKGTLYGKTGSGTVDGTGVGWYVGFVESQEKIIVFACILTGNNSSGAEARFVVEAILGSKI